MAADAQHILRLPVLGARAHDRKFGRQQLGLCPGEIDIGIDAINEAGADLLRLRAIAGIFGCHVAAIQEEPRRPVLFQIARAEIGSQQAKAALAPEVDLPEPVTGCVETLQEPEISERRCRQVGNAPFVDQNLGRSRQTRDLKPRIAVWFECFVHARPSRKIIGAHKSTADGALHQLC